MLLRHLVRLASKSLELHEVSQAALPQCGTLRTSFSSARRCGVVTKWHPFEHHGTIRDAETNAEYLIAGTRAFETVLPTSLYALEGARVSFVVDRSPCADRVVVRSHTEPLHTRSYIDVTPPVRFHSAEFYARTAAAAARAAHVPQIPSSNGEDNAERTDGQTSCVPAAEVTHSAERETGHDVLFAKDIVVDLASLHRSRGIKVGAQNGAARDAMVAGEEDEDDEEEGAVPPTQGLKDMRSCRLFDKATNLRLKLRRRLGNDDAVEAALTAMQATYAATHPPTQRTVVARQACGRIVAWSAIHHSGIIAEESEEDKGNDGGGGGGGGSSTDTRSATDAEQRLCLIRNAHAFETALPTSIQLLHRCVTFDKVQYGPQAAKTYAEHIVVAGGPHDVTPTSSRVNGAVGKETPSLRQPRPLYRFAADEAKESKTTCKVPAAAMYGVIVRWSGGQGVVQASNEQTYRIHSAADFVQLVDQHSRALRGALVLFHASEDGYARKLDLISTSAAPLHATQRPITTTATAAATDAREDAATPQEGNPARLAKATTGESSVCRERELCWMHGILLSWWPQEQQGIVYGENRARYVLRDAADTVRDYATMKPVMKPGRRLRFCLASEHSHLVDEAIVLPDQEAGQAELKEANLRQQPDQVQQTSSMLGGHSDEAIASPLCTSYWIKRMDKAGYDVREVKQLQNRALTMDELDGDDDDDEQTTSKVSANGKPNGRAKRTHFLDSEDIIKKDHWWNDPRKNIRFPNSDLTAGHLALMGPASMLNMALKAKNPKRLEKMTRKYQSRLTEEQKEYAWKQAKELAPKYEEQVKKARKQNEEPTFYFF